MDLSQEAWKIKFEADENAFLLDVRTPEEYDDGHIPEATLLNIRDPQAFVQGLESLEPSKNYYVYCRSGARGAQACQLMNQMGIYSAYNLLGGYMEWEADSAQ